MTATRAFQVIVVLDWVIYAVMFFTPVELFGPRPIERDILLSDAFNAVPWMNTTVTIGFWLFLVAAVGLFFFQRWGRTLFLALVVVSSGLGLLYGIRITHPAHVLMQYTISVMDGVIIAMAYMPSIAHHFRREEPESGPDNGPGIELR